MVGILQIPTEIEELGLNGEFHGLVWLTCSVWHGLGAGVNPLND
jgi:hypothetical protein